MANTPVRSMTFAEAAKNLVAADKSLQAAKTSEERRQAALAFASAERNARGAKQRESEAGVLDLLK